MDILTDILTATWQVFLISSPFILIGLLAAGLTNAFVSQERVARILGRPGFGSVVAAACLGIPLPLCSCSVVPVTIELSRKGASREASLAFLVSTPETGVDSILLTYGLMGPIMAVARPVAALLTSLVAALSSLLSHKQDEDVEVDPKAGEACTCAPELPERSDAFRSRILQGLRYGFGTMVDEIGFWLVAGLLLTGVITALVPDELFQGSLGSGPMALILLLLAGIPLYMCASASTPIAAALVLKGISPGAALVFLLAGPATNASSLVVIARFFGRRFIKVYLTSVVLVALMSGFLLDLLLGGLGWTVIPTLGAGHEEHAEVVLRSSAAVLSLLLLFSALRGAWKSALADLATDLGKWVSILRGAST